jgi:hypothetical protein
MDGYVGNNVGLITVDHCRPKQLELYCIFVLWYNIADSIHETGGPGLIDFI